MPETRNDASRCAQAFVATILTFVMIAGGRAAVAQADTDVTAPDPPTGLFVDEGPSWQAVDSFGVWWHTPPGQETPIAVAHYELCPAAPPGPCSRHEVAAPGISELEVAVPGPGGFWLRVWLEDSAGNVDPTAKSPQVLLRFDDGVPPQPILQYDDGWQGSDTPHSPAYDIGIHPGSTWPISGISGYSIALDGVIPDAEVDVFAAQDYEIFRAVYVFEALAEGTTAIAIRSVSNSGIASDAVRFAEIRLDRSPPVMEVDGLPSRDQWHVRPVSLHLKAADQAGLSGMAPTAPEHPIEGGGHLAYELDGGPTTLLRGGEAYVAVAEDGHHRLTYRAFDVAGNGSAEKEATFKIDGTAPVGSFRALNPADPRQLTVEVADATSGVADGHVEYRRESDGVYTRLPTSHAGGVLSARVDDVGLPPGRYELRAVVTDVAGNRAWIDDWADGSAVTIGMPLRMDAKVVVAGDLAARRCRKATKKTRGKVRRRRHAARSKCRRRPSSKAALSLRHGKRARSSGRVTTGAGTPVANASIVVEGQSRSGGASVQLGTTRTDAKGGFRFSIPAGPSRTLRYRYDGTNTIKPAAAQLVTKVRAAARLKASRRRLRNGQAVRFTGRLLGKPIPAAGKVVALQAKVGRGWRTFATPRANARGVFRHRYRFTATTGVRRYAFRAVVAREGAYPYERGVSRIVRVTVRGRR